MINCIAEVGPGPINIYSQTLQDSACVVLREDYNLAEKHHMLHTSVSVHCKVFHIASVSLQMHQSQLINAPLLAYSHMSYNTSFLKVGFVASFVSKLSDTVSSEIGKVRSLKTDDFNCGVKIAILCMTIRPIWLCSSFNIFARF